MLIGCPSFFLSGRFRSISWFWSLPKIYSLLSKFRHFSTTFGCSCFGQTFIMWRNYHLQQFIVNNKYIFADEKSPELIIFNFDSVNVSKDIGIDVYLKECCMPFRFAKSHFSFSAWLCLCMLCLLFSCSYNVSVDCGRWTTFVIAWYTMHAIMHAQSWTSAAAAV